MFVGSMKEREYHIKRAISGCKMYFQLISGSSKDTVVTLSRKPKNPCREKSRSGFVVSLFEPPEDLMTLLVQKVGQSWDSQYHARKNCLFCQVGPGKT